MTTFEEATQLEDEWTVAARLVNKRVFFSKNQDNETLRLLSLTFIDGEGTLVDVQTWRTDKVFCVHRKLVVDESYEIEGKGGFDIPNKEYSTSKYVFKKWWWVEEVDYNLRLRKYVPCCINFTKLVKITKSGRPENVLGTFVDLTEGPTKKPNIQGFFVRLRDENGYQYKVLVWHPTNLKGNKFSLLQAESGDDVLITCVRSSYLHPSEDEGDRTYTFTSLVPPALNSECVSTRRRQDLKRMG